MAGALLEETMRSADASGIGHAIRAQALRVAGQLAAPSEELLRLMGSALCTLLRAPRPDVVYQGVRVRRRPQRKRARVKPARARVFGRSRDPP